MGLGEADTRAKLIDPALHGRGWTEDLIRREETAGAVEIVERPAPPARPGPRGLHAPRQGERGGPAGGRGADRGQGRGPPARPRSRAGQALRRVRAPQRPLRLRLERPPLRRVRPDHRLDQPAPAAGRVPDAGRAARALRGRGRLRLDSDAARPLLTPYSGGEEGTRRYYQDAAIRAVLEKLARGSKRALLSLATGAGKTLHRREPAQAHRRRRASSGARSSSATATSCAARPSARFQNVFGTDAAAVSAGNPQQNARVLVATYQTLDVDREDGTAPASSRRTTPRTTSATSSSTSATARPGASGRRCSPGTRTPCRSA